MKYGRRSPGRKSRGSVSREPTTSRRAEAHRAFALEDSDNLASEVIFAFFKSIDTPVSLGLWLRYKHGEHRALAEFELPIDDYLECDVTRFRLDYAAASYLKKYVGLNSGIDKKAVALQSFASSEEKCRKTNRRLRRASISAICPKLSSYIYAMQRKIANLLGPVSLFCVEPHFGWSPGATFDVSRRRAQVDTKMLSEPLTVGPRAAELARSVIRADLHWSAALLGRMPDGPWSLAPRAFEHVDLCKVTTVPKSSKTDRVIAIEPTMNIFLQKGIGGFIRSRLKRRGIDLDDQTRNQALASAASVSPIATIDLKAASDTVSRELVWLLLPYDWASLLDSLRSRSAVMPDGSVVQLEKFSSMGNGFTFELESLVFWAAGKAVMDYLGVKDFFQVYGDDIAINREAAPELIRLLSFLGFETNKDKTFLSGLFFESCGKHYFHSVDVTPLYQKKVMSSLPELIRAHNRLYRWDSRSGSELTLGARSRIYRSAGEKGRLCVVAKSDESDTGFIVDDDLLIRCARRFCVNRGVLVNSVRPRTKVFPSSPEAFLAHKLRQNSWATGNGPLEGSDPPRAPLWEGVNAPNRSDNLIVSDTDPYGEIENFSFSGRWVMPTGFCLVPR